jgi:hypothetical protein
MNLNADAPPDFALYEPQSFDALVQTQRNKGSLTGSLRF